MKTELERKEITKNLMHYTLGDKEIFYMLYAIVQLYTINKQ